MKQQRKECQMDQNQHEETNSYLNKDDLYVIPEQLLYEIFASLLSAM